MLLTLLVLLCIPFTACTTPLNTGNNGVVKYQEFDSNSKDLRLEIVLIQEGNVKYDNIYSQKKENANVKIVPKEKYDLLIDELNSLDYLGSVNSYPSIIPGDRKSREITVKNDMGEWVLTIFSHTQEATKLSDEHKLTVAQYKKFNEYIDLIQRCYNSIFSLQYIENKDKKGFFKKAQNKLNEHEKKVNENIKRGDR